MTITPTASDGGSGLSALEVSKDGGAYAPYTAPVSFGDGKHTYQFKATDYAGNVTETPPQTVKVDTTPPAIEMPAEISLGDTLEYELSDEGSGLSTLRIVIEDDEERYPKVTGEDSISGKRLNDSLLWDGRFKDGSESPSGTYYITLKVHDVVGNESRRTCAVTVNFLSMFQSLPAYVPPTWGDVPTNAEAEPIESPVTEFGGTNNITTGSPSLQTASTGGVVVKAMDAITQLFTTPPAPAAQIPSTGNILWGAAAAAATAAFLAEIKKRKEEEKKESWKQHNAYAKLYAAVTRNSRAKQAKAQAESNQRMDFLTSHPIR